MLAQLASELGYVTTQQELRAVIQVKNNNKNGHKVITIRYLTWTFMTL